MSMTVGQFVISKLGVKSWIGKTSTTTSPASHRKKRRSLYSFINGEQMKRGSRASSLSATIGCVIHPTQLAANALPSAYDLSTDFLRGCGSLANNHSGWNSAIPAGKPLILALQICGEAIYPIKGRVISKNVHMIHMSSRSSEKLRRGKIQSAIASEFRLVPLQITVACHHVHTTSTDISPFLLLLSARVPIQMAIS